MSIEKEILDIIVSKGKFPLSKDDVTENLLAKIKKEWNKIYCYGYCEEWNYATCRSMINDTYNQNHCPYIKYGIHC